MTNGEKYLKDGTDIQEFVKEVIHYYHTNIYTLDDALSKFFKVKIRPTLTEDERVILRNIDKNFKYISRQYEDLRISYKPVGEEGELFYEFNHLFQFIKERRRI